VSLLSSWLPVEGHRLAAGETLDGIVQGYRGRVSRGAVIEAIHLVARRFVESLPKLAAVG